MCLCAQVVEALKHSSYQDYRQVILEIVKARVYQLLLDEL